MSTTLLPNGVEVSIIDDGYGKEHGLYEVAAFKDGRYVTRFVWTGLGDGNVIGWLTYTRALDFLNDAGKMYKRC